MRLMPATITDRSKCLGGSEVASICGHGWISEFELWERKTGRREDTAMTLPMRIGLVVEDLVLDTYASDRGVTLHHKQGRFQDAEHAWMTATVDAVTSDAVGVDAKFTRIFPSAWEASLPIKYIMQAQWYMGITGLTMWHIAALHGGDPEKVRVYEVQYDDAAFQYLKQRACEFWTCVEFNVPPTPAELSEVGRYFAYTAPPATDSIFANEAAMEQVERFRQAHEIEKEACAAKEAAKVQIGLYMEGAEQLTDEAGCKLVTYKNKAGGGKSSMRVF